MQNNDFVNRDLLEELLQAQKKSLFYARLAFGVSAILLIALLAAAPVLAQTLIRAEDAVTQADTILNGVSTLVEGDSASISGLVNRLNALNLEEISEAMERISQMDPEQLNAALGKVDSLDVARLNTAIANLNNLDLALLDEVVRNIDSMDFSRLNSSIDSLEEIVGPLTRLASVLRS